MLCIRSIVKASRSLFFPSYIITGDIKLIIFSKNELSKYTIQILSSTVWLCTQLFRYAETDPVMYESEVVGFYLRHLMRLFLSLDY